MGLRNRGHRWMNADDDGERGVLKSTVDNATSHLTHH
jgi:hypothetical protein